MIEFNRHKRRSTNYMLVAMALFFFFWVCLISTQNAWWILAQVLSSLVFFALSFVEIQKMEKEIKK